VSYIISPFADVNAFFSVVVKLGNLNGAPVTLTPSVVVSVIVLALVKLVTPSPAVNDALMLGTVNVLVVLLYVKSLSPVNAPALLNCTSVVLPPGAPVFAAQA